MGAMDLVALVSERVELQRSGREWVGRCPFHEDRRPSLRVSERGWWCFACQVGGDAAAWVAKTKGVGRGAALDWLEGGGRSSSAREALAEAARLYAEALAEAPSSVRAAVGRRVTEDDVRRWQVGWAPPRGVRWTSPRSALVEAGLVRATPRGDVECFRNRLVLPIRDEFGGVVGFAGRALAEAVDAPKWLVTARTRLFDKGSVLFGLDVAAAEARRRGRVVVVEGYLDAVAAHRAGLEEAVAAGGSVLTPRQAQKLVRLDVAVVVAFDGDGAGRAGADRSLRTLTAAGCADVRLVRLPLGLDPEDWLRREPAAFVEAVEAARPGWEVVVEEAATSGPAVEDRRRALLSVIGVISEAPQASVRELLAAAAAERLGVSSGRLLRDVEAARERRAPAAPRVGSGSEERRVVHAGPGPL
jgi:DNA primase